MKKCGYCEHSQKARAAFITANPADEQDYGKHPDRRMIACDPMLLLSDEWETRHGRGYVLSDGSYYDPVGQRFFGITTEG